MKKISLVFLLLSAFLFPEKILATEEVFDDLQMAISFMKKAYERPNESEAYRNLREVIENAPPNLGEELNHYSQRINGTLTQILYKGSHFGSVYRRNKSSIVFSFKGTDTLTEWVCTNPWACFKSIEFSSGNSAVGQTHKGFLDVYNGLNHAEMLRIAQRAGYEESFPRWLASFFSSIVLPSEVIFVGHSLGGAVAQLAAFDAKMYYNQKLIGPTTDFKVITAGSPKLFNAEGAREFERVFGKTNIRHLQNPIDIVPYMPCCCGRTATCGLGCEEYDSAGVHKMGIFCNLNSIWNVASSLFCCASPYIFYSSFGCGLIGCSALILNSHRVDSYSTARYDQGWW
tara:strand:+ start:723 stop:1751 length:1029 start_codon:yes stop_codon:yes gene_type:complete